MKKKNEQINSKTRGFRIPEKHRNYPADKLYIALENILFYEFDVKKYKPKEEEKLIYKRFLLTPHEEDLIAKAKEVFKIPYNKDVIALALNVLNK